MIADLRTLRSNPTVVSWVEAWQGTLREANPDCRYCGWPHYENLLCGAGSTFGVVRLGGHNYYVDTSNVEYLLKFVGELGPGHHWRDEVYFAVIDRHVVISRVEPYNGTPHLKRWTIPLEDWRGIVNYVRSKTMNCPFCDQELEELSTLNPWNRHCRRCDKRMKAVFPRQGVFTFAPEDEGRRTVIGDGCMFVLMEEA